MADVCAFSKKAYNSRETTAFYYLAIHSCDRPATKSCANWHLILSSSGM